MGVRRLLSFDDRLEIRAGLLAGLGVRAIAVVIGRSPSVVSREVARNSGRSGYKPLAADFLAERRRARPKARLVCVDEVLRARVEHDLAARKSPKAIAGRLKEERDTPGVGVLEGSPGVQGRYVSHEAIYQYVYAMPVGELKRRGVLVESGRCSRRPKVKVNARRSAPIVGMRSIEDRPELVESRAVPGSWEGDLVMGKNNATAVATLVERSTRFMMLVALPMGKDSQGLVDALIDRLPCVPKQLRTSLTWDQGTEMAKHAKLSEEVGLDVFFAHPHSPWERGSNENRNRALRRWIPKGSVITTCQEELDEIAWQINNTPLKLHDYLTPGEKFGDLISNVA